MGQSPPGETCNSDEQGTPLLNGPTEFGYRSPTPVQYTTDGRKFAHKGDILFCVRGSTTGRMNIADRTYAIGRGIAAIRHISGYEYIPYLKAIIEAKLPDLLSQSTGSTFPNVSQELLKSLRVPYHSLETQGKIAHILGTLDDKIELNRKMCKTLEEIAQTLFKHWFIDFEFPNEQGKPYKSSGGEMVDSELGPIPKRWSVVGLSDEFNITMGQSPPGSTYNQTGDGLPFFQGNADFGFRFPVNRVFCSDPRRIARPGDTLVSVRAPIGDVNLSRELCCIGRGLCSVRHKDDYQSYTYYLMKCVASILKSQNDNGTVFGSLNKRSLESYMLVRVPKVLLERYTQLVDGLSNVMENTIKEIEAMDAISEDVMTHYFNPPSYE